MSIRFPRLASLMEQIQALPPLSTRKKDIHPDFPTVLSQLINRPVSWAESDQWAERNKEILPILKLEPFFSHDKQGYPALILRTFSYDEQWRIYADPIDPIALEVKKSLFLSPFGSIPRLFAVYGAGKRSDLTGLPAEMAHEGFVVDALRILYPRFDPANPEFYPLVSQFLDTAKEKLSKIRPLMDTGSPKLLGSGVDGVAFQISKSMVLKLFKGKFALDKALSSMDILHKNPEMARTEAMVYDAGILGQFARNDVFYLIIEKMKPVSDLTKMNSWRVKRVVQEIAAIILEDETSIAKELSELKQAVKWKQASPSQIKTKIAEIVPKIVTQAKSRLDEDGIDYDTLTEALTLRPGWLPLLAEEIVIKFITGRGDLHIGNLGLSNQGEFRYFDPSHMDWTESINSGLF